MSARTAIVTGAASGIGRATVERLVGQGLRVVAADIDKERLEWATGRDDVEAVVCDVRSPADNQRLVDTAVERFGGLDVAVLNAGRPSQGTIEELPLEELDEALAVNLRGVALGLRAAVPALRAAGGGSVVVTASVSGLGGDPLLWAYNAAKAGAVNLVKAAAVDLALDGIRVNAVCPGPIRTNMTAPLIAAAPEVGEELQSNIPLQRWGEADDVAAVIAFLASDDASFVTGTAIPVDGGITAKSGQFRPATKT
ncbi:MAG: SDR family oxidoreductase [Proteobacteria bacterium]|nr:SDR family oxidoreductase [Pseudomonadota bacterium]